MITAIISNNHFDNTEAFLSQINLNKISINMENVQNSGQ